MKSSHNRNLYKFKAYFALSLNEKNFHSLILIKHLLLTNVTLFWINIWIMKINILKEYTIKWLYLSQTKTLKSTKIILCNIIFTIICMNYTIIVTIFGFEPMTSFSLSSFLWHSTTIVTDQLSNMESPHVVDDMFTKV